MDSSGIEPLVLRTLGKLARDPDSWRSLPGELAQDWPDGPPTDLLHAFVEAVTRIDSFSNKSFPSGPLQPRLYWIVSLLALDLGRMDEIGWPNRANADLIAFWEAHDSFFLDPPLH